MSKEKDRELLKELMQCATDKDENGKSNARIYMHGGYAINGCIAHTDCGLQMPLGKKDYVKVKFQDAGNFIGVCIYADPFDCFYQAMLTAGYGNYARCCTEYDLGISNKQYYDGMTIHPQKYLGKYAIAFENPLMFHSIPSYQDYPKDEKTKEPAIYRGKKLYCQDAYMVYFAKSDVRIMCESVLNCEGCPDGIDFERACFWPEEGDCIYPFRDDENNAENKSKEENAVEEKLPEQNNNTEEKADDIEALRNGTM